MSPDPTPIMIRRGAASKRTDDTKVQPSMTTPTGTTLSGPSVPPAAGGPPRQLVVLLHGLGADGRDLIDLAPMLAQALPHAAFHAPDAPLPCDMAPYGRQWFSLLDRQPAAMLAGARRAAPALDGFLDALLERYRLEPARLALLGFSQGTMMALHAALRRPRPIGALLGFSGALLDDGSLAGEVKSRPPIMLVHGDSDEIVPVEAMFQAVEMLQAAEVGAQWIVRPGLSHSIDPGGIAEGSKFLATMLDTRTASASAR